MKIIKYNGFEELTNKYIHQKIIFINSNIIHYD